LRCFVEQRQRQLLDALEHGHQTAFDLAPERLLLAVLIGAFGQRRLVEDAEVLETLDRLRLGRDHGRAIVGHQGAWEGAFLDRLGQTVDEGLGGLVEIPLRRAAQSGAVIEGAEQMGGEPLAGRGEHAPRAGVKVKMP